jgi:hypothetical protein
MSRKLSYGKIFYVEKSLFLNAGDKRKQSGFG